MEILKKRQAIDLLYALTGFRVETSLKAGILEFINWYKYYYNYN